MLEKKINYFEWRSNAQDIKSTVEFGLYPFEHSLMLKWVQPTQLCFMFIWGTVQNIFQNIFFSLVKTCMFSFKHVFWYWHFWQILYMYINFLKKKKTTKKPYLPKKIWQESWEGKQIILNVTWVLKLDHLTDGRPKVKAVLCWPH